ncbi:MAG: DUF1003 domain-containing protein [Alphaproteobacteria bacterium]
MSDDKHPYVPANIFEHEDEKQTLSQKFADAVTGAMGSWKFVFGQAIVLAAWITLNTTNILPIPHWDPNLILLNLALSTEAAFAGAFILMSQNRRSEKDRQMAQSDYHVDLSAERTIKEMDRKLDAILASIPPEHLQAMMKKVGETAQQASVSNDNADATAAKRAAKPGGPA